MSNNRHCHYDIEGNGDTPGQEGTGHVAGSRPTTHTLAAASVVYMYPGSPLLQLASIDINNSYSIAITRSSGQRKTTRNQCVHFKRYFAFEQPNDAGDNSSESQETTQPRACDYCRQRSIRCRVSSDGADCQHCVVSNQPCTWDRPRKRRGAPPRSSHTGEAWAPLASIPSEPSPRAVRVPAAQAEIC